MGTIVETEDSAHEFEGATEVEKIIKETLWIEDKNFRNLKKFSGKPSS
jgi:hypothetical protein